MNFQIVECVECWQWEDSELLREREYQKHGIPYHFQLNGTRLLVIRDGGLVGTISILECRPLPIEEYAGELILSLRNKYEGNVVEVGQFATDDLRPSEQIDLLSEVSSRLIKGEAASEWAVAVCGIHPDREIQYRRLMGWEPISKPRILPGSNVPVLIMKMSLSGFSKSVLGRRLHRNKP